jgi:hypothetical protein
MILIRDAVPDDVGFIFDSWAQSYWGAPAIMGMTRDAYFAEMRRVVPKLMQSPVARARVAVPDGDVSTILGWAVYEDQRHRDEIVTVLHYVFVRLDLRGCGIARMLLAPKVVQAYTHRSRKLDPERLPKGLAYNPFLLWSDR